MREGPEAGQEAFQVRTGAGLSYRVHPSKGMDISLAEFCGIPVSWSASNGNPNPSYYDAGGNNLLRTASGGLLMTSGLSQVGASGQDEYGSFGLHGQIHHTPARQTSYHAEWHGNDYEMFTRGVLEETSIFGHTLRLTRTIISRLGGNRLKIMDTVENASFKAMPHMMLYHFNFGFPLLMEDTIIVLPESKSTSRDVEMDMPRLHEWQAPDPLFAEQVYYHEPLAGGPLTDIQRVISRTVDMGDRFRLIVNEVNAVQNEKRMPHLPVASLLWKPEPSLTKAAEAWILAGGAHHFGFSFHVGLGTHGRN